MCATPRLLGGWEFLERDAEYDRDPAHSETSDHSCKAVSVYGNG